MKASTRCGIVRDVPVLLLILSFVCQDSNLAYAADYTRGQMASVRGMAPQEDGDYDSSWNTPTISHRATGHRYGFFGKIGPWEREDHVDLSSLPPIPGLKHSSCLEFCPNDTCFSVRALIALRCPDSQALRDWVSERLRRFEIWVTTGHFALTDNDSYSFDHSQTLGIPSSNALLAQYIDGISRTLVSAPCRNNQDGPDFNQQHSILLTDCWRQGVLYTFYEATWYDWMSSGDNTTESYSTINARTGKELHLDDLIVKGSEDRLGELVKSHLENADGNLWNEGSGKSYGGTPAELLERRSGVALIREGLVVFYHPYVIGTGADGQFTAVIPYNELKGILNPWTKAES